ncbi:uncharacterized protein LOC111717912 isoform X2 [Eurytemora carolleeae]|uniref:uncharacterized protein LOC111717912 isoform X2 n=1 Tax=Eurytemora carolleeae TaxID=1294199 RepID=UPI000C790C2B|nr:uncharacterized protein LOC111717912 isoform X2 [Eurytemora carolleeae]|eukprot:XP_023349141.1 uncharacterized protein LOC111717912 isoform X2 [Eurytemora affinis]
MFGNKPQHNENQDQQDTSIDLDKEADNPSLPIPTADCVKIKPKWGKVRDKHCPITSGLVQEGRGDALRHSIFDEKKYSFKNLKLTKSTTVRVGPEAVKLKEVTSSKAFEDRATHILNEMRKQRRSLQLEYVAKVSVPKKVSGWRDKLNRSDSLKKDEQNLQQYLGKKRNSITKLAGHLKRKLSISKPEGTEEKNSSELEKDETESPRTFARSMNPLDFIMMKEEYIRKNPPPPRKEFVKERSVESESGKQSMESVMNSLKKIVKAINPRREFPSDVKKREDDEYRKREDQRAKVSAQLREEILARARPSTWASACSWENRMQKYRGASITPFNSYATRWNSLQDLRQVEEEKKVVDKKAVRERIQNKVLSLVNQPKERRLEDYFKDCDHRDFSVKGRTKIKPIDYLIPGILPTREIILALEAVEYRRRELTDIIAHFSKEIKTKKKAHTVKPIEHGKGEKGESKYSYGLVTRSNALWETVKPINVAVRMKTEMFSSNLHIPIRAKVSVDSLYVAITTCPGSVGSTQYSEQHKWEHLKGCALFSIVGLSEPVLSIAVQNRLLVVSLPTEEVLAQEQADATFTKCERKPQSQLVKDMITTSSGSLSRISFHTQITFNYFDAVMLVTRFLRTKKNATRYKWKREEVIAREFCQQRKQIVWDLSPGVP